jgi:hypothetical protein
MFPGLVDKILMRLGEHDGQALRLLTTVREQSTTKGKLLTRQDKRMLKMRLKLSGCSIGVLRDNRMPLHLQILIQFDMYL